MNGCHIVTLGIQQFKFIIVSVLPALFCMIGFQKVIGCSRHIVLDIFKMEAILKFCSFWIMNLIQLWFFVEKPVWKVLFKSIQPFGRYSGQTQTKIVVVVVLKLRGYYSLCPLIQIVCKKELTNKICYPTTWHGSKTTQVFVSCGTSQYFVFWRLLWRNGL